MTISFSNPDHAPSTQHNVNKRFFCTADNCNKAFSTHAHLLRHQLNHWGQRKYRCDLPGCTQAFFRSDAMNQHKKAHQKRLLLAGPPSQVPSHTPVAHTIQPTSEDPTALLLQAANMVQSTPIIQISVPSTHNDPRPTLHIFTNTQRIPSPPTPLYRTTISPTVNSPHLIKLSPQDPALTGKIQSWLEEQSRRRRLDSTYYLRTPSASNSIYSNGSGHLVPSLISDAVTPTSDVSPQFPQPEGARKTSIAFLCE